MELSAPILFYGEMVYSHPIFINIYTIFTLRFHSQLSSLTAYKYIRGHVGPQKYIKCTHKHTSPKISSAHQSICHMYTHHHRKYHLYIYLHYHKRAGVLENQNGENISRMIINTVGISPMEAHQEFDGQNLDPC